MTDYLNIYGYHINCRLPKHVVNNLIRVDVIPYECVITKENGKYIIYTQNVYEHGGYLTQKIDNKPIVVDNIDFLNAFVPGTKIKIFAHNLLTMLFIDSDSASIEINYYNPIEYRVFIKCYYFDWTQVNCINYIVDVKDVETAKKYVTQQEFEGLELAPVVSSLKFEFI